MNLTRRIGRPRALPGRRLRRRSRRRPDCSRFEPDQCRTVYTTDCASGGSFCRRACSHAGSACLTASQPIEVPVAYTAAVRLVRNCWHADRQQHAPDPAEVRPGRSAAENPGCLLLLSKAGPPLFFCFFFLSSAAPPLVCYSTGARAARLFVGRRLLLATRRSRYYGGPPRKRREGGGRKRTPPSSRPVRGSVREWGVIAGEFVFCILHPPRTHTAHHRPS